MKQMKLYSVYLDATIPATTRFIIEAETPIAAERIAVAEWRKIILADAKMTLLDPDELVIRVHYEETSEAEDHELGIVKL